MTVTPVDTFRAPGVTTRPGGGTRVDAGDAPRSAPAQTPRKKGTFQRLRDVLGLASLRAKRKARAEAELGAHLEKLLDQLAQAPRHAGFRGKVEHMLPDLDKLAAAHAGKRSDPHRAIADAVSARLERMSDATVDRIWEGVLGGGKVNSYPGLWKAVQARQKSHAAC